MPFFAKDIFNTQDFHTEMGSSIWKNFRAGNNARVIDNLIDDGAILIGKSTTAEFAVHYETNCRNALDSNRIPGTSSTGSAGSTGSLVSDGSVLFTVLFMQHPFVPHPFAEHPLIVPPLIAHPMNKLLAISKSNIFFILSPLLDM